MTSGRKRAGVGTVDPGGQGIDDSVVYVASLPDGPIMVLTGAAALTYRVLRARSLHPHEELAAALGVEVQDLDQEALQDFAAELAERGLA